MAVEVHQLSTHQEFAGTVRLQQQIWGFKDIELLPQRLFVVAAKIGGQVLGAFDDEKLVAFCLCIPGLKTGGKPYLHSHMLGVLPEYRNTGLGRRLKLKQREFALAQGIDLIEWTFDPLEIKNAFFNIERLGVIARRYVHNQYGKTSSHLHGGLPTDRLIAEWWIRSERAEAACTNSPYQTSLPQASVSIPAGIERMKRHDPRRVREIQAEAGEQFTRHFGAGLAIAGFERTDRAGTYLLSAWELK